MRIESEIELNSGRKFLVYASISKMEDRVECIFEDVFPIEDYPQNNVEEPSDDELDQIAEILAYQFDDLKKDYND